MMNSKIQLLIILWLLASLPTRAQPAYTQRVRVINKQIAAAYLHHDTTALFRIYAGDAVSMPEYHLTLFGKKAIASYLRSWMDSARVTSYFRQTHDITKAGDYLVETGTFSNIFSLQKKAVEVQRRGNDFATYYTDDAIYMPYYMPMKIGKAAIDGYYREHEDPNTGIDAVHIGSTRIIDTGDYVLVDAYYKVDWRGGSSHGTVTGKNISVWKRDPSFYTNRSPYSAGR